VSAFAKLSSFRPRFLLESVEGGERLGRYSFIGFGDGLEVRLDSRSLVIGPHSYPVPGSKEALLERLREALARAPRPQPDPGENVVVMELDELWHFLQKKRTSCGSGWLLIALANASSTGNVAIVMPPR
jgi:anthranilate/para-aminobenzoate synthase component I